MQKFDGFPPGKTRHVLLPALFFDTLLPLIDDLAELKVTLFCFNALLQKEGQYRYLLRRDFADNDTLLRGLQAIDPQADPQTLLDAALARAVERQTLLTVELEVWQQVEHFYFMNTALGRAAYEQVRRGIWRPSPDERPIEILAERPNVFKLYEENIGPLTPMISDALKDAEATYPDHWLDEAMRIAVENNKRSWRYIEAILKRWEAEGKDREAKGRQTQRDITGDDRAGFSTFRET